jgi:hypothetical protein
MPSSDQEQLRSRFGAFRQSAENLSLGLMRQNEETEQVRQVISNLCVVGASVFLGLAGLLVSSPWLAVTLAVLAVMCWVVWFFTQRPAPRISELYEEATRQFHALEQTIHATRQQPDLAVWLRTFTEASSASMIRLRYMLSAPPCQTTAEFHERMRHIIEPAVEVLLRSPIILVDRDAQCHLSIFTVTKLTQKMLDNQLDGPPEEAGVATGDLVLHPFHTIWRYPTVQPPSFMPWIMRTGDWLYGQIVRNGHFMYVEDLKNVHPPSAMPLYKKVFEGGRATLFQSGAGMPLTARKVFDYGNWPTPLERKVQGLLTHDVRDLEIIGVVGLFQTQRALFTAAWNEENPSEAQLSFQRGLQFIAELITVILLQGREVIQPPLESYRPGS